jgi:hypothetical protein
MPLLQPYTLAPQDFALRDATGNASLSANATATNALQVICAWPLSGNYGVGEGQHSPLKDENMD